MQSNLCLDKFIYIKVGWIINSRPKISSTGNASISSYGLVTCNYCCIQVYHKNNNIPETSFMHMLAVMQVAICDMLIIIPRLEIARPVRAVMYFCNHMILINTVNINWGFTCTLFKCILLKYELNPRTYKVW